MQHLTDDEQSITRWSVEEEVGIRNTLSGTKSREDKSRDDRQNIGARAGVYNMPR